MKFSSTDPAGLTRGSGQSDVAASWSWSDFTAGVGARPSTQAPRTAEQAEEARQAELRAAYQQGLQKGRAEGEAEAMEQLATVLSAVNGAACKVRDAAEPWTRAAGDNVLGLALAVARRIVDRELDGDAETYARLVRNALDRFPVDQEVRIRLNPSDLALLSRPSGEGEGLEIEGVRKVRWIPDAGLKPGDVILEGPERVVDGSVDRALERIYYELKDD